MIQRKQSIWLLLAVLLNAAVFLGANFSIETRIQNVLQTNRYTVLQHLPSTLFILAAIVLSLIAIFLFGGDSIKGFMFALIVGIGVGTYSSWFIASPILYDTVKKLNKNKK